MIYDSDYLDDFFIIFWLFLFFLTLIIELKLKQLSLISFSFASLIASLCGVMFAPAIFQLIIFIAFSFVFTLLLYPLKKKNREKRIFENQICTFIGREALVLKRIGPGLVGQIKFYDIIWEALPAKEYFLEIGEEVLISGKLGINLIVSKINSK